MSGAQGLIDQIISAVDYLRVHVGSDGSRASDGSDGSEWVRCEPLVADPDRLGQLVRATMRGRGTDRADVATSLFVQGYAFRIASLAIGGWLLADQIIDLTPSRTAIRLGRDRPNAVAVDVADVITSPPSPTSPTKLGTLHAHLIDEHLARLVACAHDSCRVGAPLLWGNVAASCASSFGAFSSAPALADRRIEIRDRAQAFFACARDEMRTAGELVPVADRFAWERKSCCLWYLTESGFKCEDCSLWSADERAVRYERLRSEAGG